MPGQLVDKRRKTRILGTGVNQKPKGEMRIYDGKTCTQNTLAVRLMVEKATLPFIGDDIHRAWNALPMAGDGLEWPANGFL